MPPGRKQVRAARLIEASDGSCWVWFYGSVRESGSVLRPELRKGVRVVRVVINHFLAAAFRRTSQDWLFKDESKELYCFVVNTMRGLGRFLEA